jgi:hypothetical protein
MRELGRQFVPRRGFSSLTGLSGKYVLVVPFQFTMRTMH